MTDVERKIDRLEAKLETYMQSQDKRFDSFVQEMRQQNQMRANEIRDLQKRQDEERRAREVEMKEAQRKHEEDMREILANIDDKFDKLSSQLKMMTLTTILFSGLITWMILAVLK